MATAPKPPPAAPARTATTTGPPRLTAAERRALAAVADISRRFDGLIAELAEVGGALPPPPEPELDAMCTSARPPSVAFYLWRAIACLLTDEARPLAAALSGLAAVTPAGLVSDWRRELSEQRRARERFAGEARGAAGTGSGGEGGR